jgi:hypothetical protein
LRRRATEKGLTEVTMEGEVSFTLSETDYADGIRDSYVARIFTTGTGVRLAVVLLFCAMVGALTAWLDGDMDSLGFSIAGFALLGLVLIAFIYACAFLNLKRRARRLYRQQRSLHQPYTYRWSKAGLDIEAPNMQAFHAWPDFHRWVAARRAILLFLNDQLFFVLPRRVFGEAELEAIESHLSAAGVRRL